MPELNTIGGVMDRDLDIKLIKGPGKNLSGDLIFSELASQDQGNSNVFDFVLRAFVSGSRTAP